jgi:hypothetical protein
LSTEDNLFVNADVDPGVQERRRGGAGLTGVSGCGGCSCRSVAALPALRGPPARGTPARGRQADGMLFHHQPNRGKSFTGFQVPLRMASR